MAWQDEMSIMVRVMIGDTSATPTNSDDSLEQLLALSARQVLNELSFDQEYTVNVENATISPDPTAAATLDDAFINLVTLKAASILDRSGAGLAAKRAILVKDGSSAIDLSKVSESMIKLLEKGWSAVYADAKWQYLYDQSSSIPGMAIMTPFRLYAYSYCASERDRINPYI